MVIHAGPESPIFDVYLDDVERATNLSRFENTSYLSAKGGSHTLEIDAASSPQLPSLLTRDIELSSPERHSAFVTSISGQVSALIMSDDFTPPDSANSEAKLRFVNLSPDLSSADLFRLGADSTLSNNFIGLSFKDYSGFETITAGTYDLELRSSGSSQTLTGLNSIDLRPGRVYTVFAAGYVSGVSGQELELRAIQNYYD
jgi:hypothetical protein